VGSKLNALFGNLAELRQGEHLKAAAIRQNRSVPIEEFVNTAHIVNNVITRTDVEMIRIGKLNLTTDVVEVLRRNTALDGCGSTYVHENGGLDRSVNGFKRTAARATLLLQ
jgi:hypothetical protein